MLVLCAATKADAICIEISSTSFKSNPPRDIRSRSVSPSTYSIAMKCKPSISSISDSDRWRDQLVTPSLRRCDRALYPGRDRPHPSRPRPSLRGLHSDRVLCRRQWSFCTASACSTVADRRVAPDLQSVDLSEGNQISDQQ